VWQPFTRSRSAAKTIRLGQLLKLSGLAETGGASKALLADGVRVNGVAETRRGRQLRAGDVVEALGRDGAGGGGMSSPARRVASVAVMVGVALAWGSLASADAPLTPTKFTIPTSGSVPAGITAVPTATCGSPSQAAAKIGRITPAGTIAEPAGRPACRARR